MVKKVIILSPVLLGILFLGSIGEQSPDAATQLQQAEAYKKAGSYQEALGIYQQVVLQNPGTEFAFQAQKNLVFLYIVTDQQPQAEAALRELLSGYSGHERLPHSIHEVIEQCVKPGKCLEARQLCQNLLSNPSLSNQAIWLQMGVALSNTYLGDDQALTVAVGSLIRGFSNDSRIAEAVDQVAWSCRKLQKYDKACLLYQYVVDNWPDNERVIFAQRGIVLSKLAVGDGKAAWAAIQKLVSEFSQNVHITEVVYHIAENYRDTGKYEEARVLYRYIIDNWPQSEQVIWSLRGVALSSIALGDESGIEAATETLFAQFSGNRLMAQIVYQIARKLKDDQKAVAIYQYVIQNHPDSEFAVLSQVIIGNIYIRLDDEASARSIFDKVLADFSTHPILPKAVALMADGYYDKALLEEQGNHNKEAGEYYQKAIVECERIITQLPETVYITPEAHKLAGDCYLRLGQDTEAVEYYRRVVDNWPDYKYAWNALFRIGRSYEEFVESGLMSKSQADPVIKAVYQQLVRKYPDCKMARYARRWLGRHNSAN